MLGRDGRKMAELHAAVLGGRSLGVALPAEDRDLVAEVDESRAELLDVALDPTDRRRDALLADHRDRARINRPRHRPRPRLRGTPRARTRRWRSGENSSSVAGTGRRSHLERGRGIASARRPSAAASASGSSGGTTRPVTPSITSSGSPPRSVVTTGRPAANASRIDHRLVLVPAGREHEDERPRQRASASAPSRAVRASRSDRRTGAPQPRSRDRSGPSPAIATRIPGPSSSAAAARVSTPFSRESRPAKSTSPTRLPLGGDVDALDEVWNVAEPVG